MEICSLMLVYDLLSGVHNEKGELILGKHLPMELQ